MEFTEGNDGWDLGRKQKLTVGKIKQIGERWNGKSVKIRDLE